jgi:hypothetical protein
MTINNTQALSRDLYCQVKWTTHFIGLCLRDTKPMMASIVEGPRKWLDSELKYLREYILIEDLFPFVVLAVPISIVLAAAWILSIPGYLFLNIALIMVLLCSYCSLKKIDLSKPLFVRESRWRFQKRTAQELGGKLWLSAILFSVFIFTNGYSWQKLFMFFVLWVWLTLFSGRYFHTQRLLEKG